MNSISVSRRKNISKEEKLCHFENIVDGISNKGLNEDEPRNKVKKTLKQILLFRTRKKGGEKGLTVGNILFR